MVVTALYILIDCLSGYLLQEKHRAIHTSRHMSFKHSVLYTVLVTWILSITFSSSRGECSPTFNNLINANVCTMYIPGLGSWGARPWSRVHMMRSGRSDPRLMVREVEEDDNQEDNEDQETFELHGADPDSNISLEKRSGLGQN